MSTKEQGSEDHFSLEHQASVIRQYAADRGWVVGPMLQYVESGGSNRHILRRILDQVRRESIDVVMVSELDRLARDLVATMGFIEDLQSAGCHFVSVKDGFDATDPAGQMQTAMLAMFAQFFRAQLSRKVKGGQHERWKSGKRHGERPFGYQPGPDGRWEPDDDEAPIVHQVFDWYLHEDWGTRRIAKCLNDRGVRGQRGRTGTWDARTIQHMLRRRVYCGDTIYGQWINTQDQQGFYHQRQQDPQVQRDTHQSIVERQMWDATQERIEAKRRLGPRAQKSIYLLSGLVRCGRCGGSMSIQHGRTYVCRAYVTKGLCQRNGVDRALCEHAVLQSLEQVQQATRHAITQSDWVQWAAYDPGGVTWFDRYRSERRKRLDYTAHLDRARQAYLAGIFDLEEYSRVRREITCDAHLPPIPANAQGIIQRVVQQALDIYREALISSDKGAYRQPIQQYVRSVTCLAGQLPQVELGMSPDDCDPAGMELPVLADVIH